MREEKKFNIRARGVHPSTGTPSIRTELHDRPISEKMRRGGGSVVGNQIAQNKAYFRRVTRSLWTKLNKLRGGGVSPYWVRGF